MERIINQIEEHGYFWYEPKIWSKELDEELTNLTQSGVITTIDKLGIKFINESYCFTYADNRFKLQVKTSGNTSMLVCGKEKVWKD